MGADGEAEEVEASWSLQAYLAGVLGHFHLQSLLVTKEQFHASAAKSGNEDFRLIGIEYCRYTDGDRSIEQSVQPRHT